MIKFYNNKILYVILIIVLFMFGVFISDNSRVVADTTTKSIDVSAFTQSSTTTETTTDDGGGGGSDSSPTISNINTSTKMNSAIVSWEATDDVKVEKCEFKYSSGINYDNTASVSSSNRMYSVEIEQLNTSTQYNFKIMCYDKVQDSEEKGKFTTLSSDTIDLEVLAEPEKRVNDNLTMSFYLFLINPDTNEIIYELQDVISSTGKFSKKNVKVPEKNNVDAVLKGKTYLAKKIIGIDLSKDKKVTLDFTDQGSFQLIAGDLAGEGLKDNVIDVLDVSSMLKNQNSNIKKYDLNRDGVVDVLDLSIVLKNLNKCKDNLQKIKKEC